jgi:hypothetical protein
MIGARWYAYGERELTAAAVLARAACGLIWVPFRPSYTGGLHWPLHCARHNGSTSVTVRWPTDVNPRPARLSRPTGARNPSPPTRAKT